MSFLRNTGKNFERTTIRRPAYFSHDCLDGFEKLTTPTSHRAIAIASGCELCRPPIMGRVGVAEKRA
jgi:hypothetical protein